MRMLRLLNYFPLQRQSKSDEVYDMDSDADTFVSTEDLSPPNSSSNEGMMNTTAICKLKGSLDILISPLTLEAVQR